jgi:beta-glucosidase
MDIKHAYCKANELAKSLPVNEQIGQLCQIPANLVDPVQLIKDRKAGSILHVSENETMRLQKLAIENGNGIPLLFGIDAIHGHCFSKNGTVFPTQLALSSSWNRDLIEKVGRVTAIETAASGIHWTFSPVLCIGRDPRWGRIGETFGEDPYLIAELGRALIKGLQGTDLSQPDSIMACAKHFIAYGETQGGRDSSEADVSMRKIMTYFFPPFEQAVKAGCASYMTAYNAIDGLPCTIRKDLIHLLKSIPGFEGLILTDWDNIGYMVKKQKVFSDYESASVAAVDSGNDVIMSTMEFYDSALRVIDKGKMSREAIYNSCVAVLAMKYRLNLFENPYPQESIKITVKDKKNFRQVALKAAEECIVLLKNNAVLPLKDNINHIAVIGPAADDYIGQLGDWSFGPGIFVTNEVNGQHKEQTITILNGIQNRAPQSVKVSYCQGCHITDKSEKFINSAYDLSVTADVVILALGDTIDLYGERKDRVDLGLPGAQLELANKVLECGKPVIVIVQSGRPLDVSQLESKASAILFSWNSGIEGGNAIARILFGDVNPSGKLTVSVPFHVGQLPVYYNQLPGWHTDRYIDMTADALYPFGFGLSYTRFKYSDLFIDKATYNIDEIICGKINIENVGNLDGETVVQVYVHDVISSATTPVKCLKWFEKHALKSGEVKTVNFKIPVDCLAIVNTDLKKVVEPGEFIIYAGEDSVTCLDLKVLVTIECR